MKDYASPIEMITNSIIKSDEEQLDDCMLFSVEREIGFKVDKEELIKALEYDRKQYEKGFEDGLKSAVDWIPVSEGLPKTRTGTACDVNEYLVTVVERWKDSDEWEYHVDVATNWGTYIDDFWDTYNDWCEGQEVHVIAWMPLPKSYKQEAQNE